MAGSTQGERARLLTGKQVGSIPTLPAISIGAPWAGGGSPKPVRVGSIPTAGANSPRKPNGAAPGCNPGQGVRLAGGAPLS